MAEIAAQLDEIEAEERAAIDELVEDGRNRPQHTGRQSLCLVEHQNATGQIV